MAAMTAFSKCYRIYEEVCVDDVSVGFGGSRLSAEREVGQMRWRAGLSKGIKYGIACLRQGRDEGHHCQSVKYALWE